MKLEKLLEYQNILWVIIIGLGLIVFGFYLFNELIQYEQSGGAISIPKMFRIFYNIFGKYGALLLCEAVGVIALASGIWQLREAVKK